MTLSAAGGAVGVRCVGTRIEPLFVRPAVGYALDQQNVSGSTLTVRFESDGARSRLRADCASGAPVLLEARDEPRGGGSDDRDDRDDRDGERDD